MNIAITIETKPEDITIPLGDGWVAELRMGNSEIIWIVWSNNYGYRSGYGKTIAEAMQNAKERKS